MPTRFSGSALAAGATVLLALAALVAPLPAGASPAPVERELDVRARMFAYEPARIAVGRGDRVTLVLHSEDVVHGLYVDGYDVNLLAEPGKPARATFVADRAGKFRFRCSVSCGAMHPFMIGELVVGPNLPFWRAAAALAVVALGTVTALAVRRPEEEGP